MSSIREFGREPKQERPVKMTVSYSAELFRRLVAYPVIVEMWEKKNSGRVKRAWLKEFTEAERKKIGEYHAKFRAWHLHTGCPDRVQVSFRMLELLQRACNFFGTI